MAAMIDGSSQEAKQMPRTGGCIDRSAKELGPASIARIKGTNHVSDVGLFSEGGSDVGSRARC